MPFRQFMLRLHRTSFRLPAFSPLFEEQYTSHSDSSRSGRRWIEGLLSIGLYLAYIAARQVVLLDRSKLTLLLRFGVALPSALLANVVLWFKLKPSHREALVLITSCLVGSVEVFLAYAHRNDGTYAVHFAVITVLVFVNTVMRLRLTYALLAFSWAVLAECLSAVASTDPLEPGQMLRSGMVLAIGILTLISNHDQDREARLSFLRYSEKNDLVASLSQSNMHLATAALTDTLTGLANRAFLDSYLTKIWSDPTSAARDCSIVMVDIDNFKMINDRYGHLYGDRVIKRIAHLLSEALRGEDDFIARYGGEEFLVLLPHTPAHLGVIVAERLRGLVELAGLPALRAGDPNLDGMSATVSCGVAGCLPELYPKPHTLIGQADEALYRAKREGRNRVRVWQSPSELSVEPADVDNHAPEVELETMNFKAG